MTSLCSPGTWYLWSQTVDSEVCTGWRSDWCAPPDPRLYLQLCDLRPSLWASVVVCTEWHGGTWIWLRSYISEDIKMIPFLKGWFWGKYHKVLFFMPFLEKLNLNFCDIRRVEIISLPPERCHMFYWPFLKVCGRIKGKSTMAAFLHPQILVLFIKFIWSLFPVVSWSLGICAWP